MVNRISFCLFNNVLGLYDDNPFPLFLKITDRDLSVLTTHTMSVTFILFSVSVSFREEPLAMLPRSGHHAQTLLQCKSPKPRGLFILDRLRFPITPHCQRIFNRQNALRMPW